MTDLRTKAAQARDVTVGRDAHDPAPEPKAEPAPVSPQWADVDVDASGVPVGGVTTVFEAWSRVMAEVQAIGKGTSKGLNYAFRGIDAVLNAVGPALRKHGVTVVPTGGTAAYEVITSKSGAVMNYCRVTMTYAVFGPNGDPLPVPIVSLGEAFDTGDKATVKAQSVALRTMYINALAIPVDAPERDPEHGVQHERGVPAPPKPSEYYAEIMKADPPTSVDRLRQIRIELNDHPSIGSTVVEVDGEDITLLKLCTKIGRERAGN